MVFIRFLYTLLLNRFLFSFFYFHFRSLCFLFDGIFHFFVGIRFLLNIYLHKILFTSQKIFWFLFWLIAFNAAHLGTFLEMLKVISHFYNRLRIYLQIKICPKWVEGDLPIPGVKFSQSRCCVSRQGSVGPPLSHCGLTLIWRDSFGR